MSEQRDGGLDVSDAELRALLDDHREWVRRCLTDAPARGWMPKLTALTQSAADGPREVVIVALAADFNEHGEKREAMRAAGKAMYEARRAPLAVAFSSEAWRSEQRKGVPLIQPRDDPARQEIIVVVATTIRGDRVLHTHLPVTRAADGTMALGEAGEVLEGGEANVLRPFFAGFLEEAARRLGHPN